MYDAIEDPYTYKNSTVLVNKLDLRRQAELEAFEAEISNARAEEPTERWTSLTTKLSIIICFRTSTTGLVRFALCECRKAAVRFVFSRTSKDKRTSYSTICELLTT
jgi:hypothetical protein